MSEASAPPATTSSATATQKKNTNSYYYWHGHGKDRAAVGDVAPMPVPVLVKTDASASETAEPLPVMMKKYSWCDDGASVSVYVSYADGEHEQLVEESVTVDFSKKNVLVALEVLVNNNNGTIRRKKQLRLPLSKAVDVSSCVFKVKAAKKEVYIKLRKAEDGTWFDLLRKGDEQNDSDAE